MMQEIRKLESQVAALEARVAYLEKDRNEFAKDRLNWKSLANQKGAEVLRLRAALEAIAAKGPSSPGDKKSEMAKAALVEQATV